MPPEQSVMNATDDSLRAFKRLMSSTDYVELLDIFVAISKAQKTNVVLKGLSMSSFLAFYFREDGAKELRDGDMVAVNQKGKIVNVDDSQIISRGYAVVNDSGAKKLGYTMLSKGHWCITLGVANVVVDGIVNKGDMIGPKCDGKGQGSVVVDPSTSPFCGFVVESKANTKGSADSKRTVTILLSQDYETSTSVSEASSTANLSKDQPMQCIMTMLERLTYFFNPGNEQTKLLDAFAKLRAYIFPDTLAQSCAINLRHVLQGEKPTGEDGSDHSSKPGFRFGLPVPARTGNLRFQSRNIKDSDSVSFDALTFFENKIRGTANGKVLAITGKAGTGKSTLLNAVAFRLHRNLTPSPIIWIDASSTSAICRSMISFAKALIQLGLTSRIDPNRTQQVGAVQIVDGWLRKEKGWILVLDGLANLSDLSTINIPYASGTVLLSTRTSKEELCSHFDSCKVLEIGPFQKDEAVEYLQKHTGITDTDAMSISRKLEYSPASIALAAAHLCSQKNNVLQLSLEIDAKSTHRTELSVDADIPFLPEILEVQIADLRNTQPQCCNLLFMLSFWNSKSMPVRMIDENRFPDSYFAVSFLLHQSLVVEAQPGMINMHEVVQQILRTQLREWSQRDEKARTCCGLGNRYNKGVELMGYTDCLQCASKSALAYMQSPDKEGGHVAAPHAIKLIEFGCQDLPLLTTTAQYLSEVQKDYKKSLELRQIAHKTQIDLVKTPNHDSVAIVLCGIARTHEMMGQHQDAVSTYEDVVRIWKRVKKDTLDVAKILDSIGLIFYKTERFKGALLRFEESLSLKESIQDKDVKTELIFTLERIADSYHAQGYYDIALQKWKQALVLYQSLQSARQLDLARVLNTMGLIYADLQQYDEALQSYDEALEKLKDCGSEGEILVATIYTSKAKTYQCLGKYDLVLEEYKNALMIQKRKCSGREQYAISATLDEIAYVHTVLGGYNEAAICLEDSLKIKKEIFDPDSLHIAKAFFDLAVQQKNVGKKTEAIDSVAKAHDIYVRKLGSTDAKALQASTLHSELLGINNSGTQISSPNRSYNQYILDISKMIGSHTARSPSSQSISESVEGPNMQENGNRMFNECSPRVNASTPRTPRTPKTPRTSRTPRKKKTDQQEGGTDGVSKSQNITPPCTPPRKQNSEVECVVASPKDQPTGAHNTPEESSASTRHSARRPPTGNRYRKTATLDKASPHNVPSGPEVLQQIKLSFEEGSGNADSPNSLHVVSVGKIHNNADQQDCVHENGTPRQQPSSSQIESRSKEESESKDGHQQSIHSPEPASDCQSPRTWSRSPRVLQKVPWPPSNPSPPRQQETANENIRTPRSAAISGSATPGSGAGSKTSRQITVAAVTEPMDSPAPATPPPDSPTVPPVPSVKATKSDENWC